MFVRYSAWLRAVPEVKGRTHSRLAQYELDGITPELPPQGAAGYLIAHLWEIGPTTGEGPITHGEIAAWQANMGIELQPWESLLLRRLSLDHLGQSQLSTKVDCIPPWGELYRAPNVDAKIDAALD